MNWNISFRYKPVIPRYDLFMTVNFYCILADDEVNLNVLYTYVMLKRNVILFKYLVEYPFCFCRRPLLNKYSHVLVTGTWRIKYPDFVGPGFLGTWQPLPVRR